MFLAFSREADSSIFKFSNGKGYICTVLQNENNLCFQNKSPYDNLSFDESAENNQFQFVISQEDFENANDLPD